MSILLKNATFINYKTLDFKNTNILVEKGKLGKLKFIENTADFPENCEIINCTGKFVTKSFAVGHHHVYSGLAKGMGAPKKNPRDFNQILEYIWWTLDKSLDKDTIEASALATAMACAKAGSTFAIDHHASPNAITGALDIIGKAFDKVGVSHLLCYEISDRDGLDKAQEGLAETDSYLASNQGLIGLHASFTCGDETMKAAALLAEKHNTGVHIHVAEDLFDENHCLQNYNKRVVNRINDFGMLNYSSTILGHCLHVDKAERKILKAAPIYIVQNTESNLNNNVGFFYKDGLNDNIMLGTDGMHSDMLQSAKAAFFTGQAFDTIDFSDAYQRFRKVHQYLEVNKFEGDAENNLVVLDYDTATEMNSSNFLGHFIFGLRASHVQHVISDGKLIVKDRILTTVNEAEILDFTKEQAKRLWAEMAK